MDIDKMEAGKEMDALVAERVMGWKVDKESYSTWVAITDTYLFFPLVGMTKGSWGNWTPSTDISAVWQVVEKMSETWEFSLNYQDNKYKFLLWKPEWVTSNLYQARECKEGVSNTVPLAICRAALKAVERVDVV